MFSQLSQNLCVRFFLTYDNLDLTFGPLSSETCNSKNRNVHGPAVCF